VYIRAHTDTQTYVYTNNIYCVCLQVVGHSLLYIKFGC